MKGATLVSRPDCDPRRALVGLADALRLDVTLDDGVVQAVDSSKRRFTLYGDADPEWEWRNADLELANGGSPPDFSSYVGFAIECRWEKLFADIVNALGGVCVDLWIIDGDGAVLRAADVSPTNICL